MNYISDNDLNIIFEKIDDRLFIDVDNAFTTFIESTNEESSINKLIKKVEKIVMDVLKAISDFITKSIKAIDIKVQQFKLNVKLNELKNALIEKRQKILGVKYNYFDILKYKAYYSDFINKYTDEVKKGLNKDFKNVNEYEKWRNEMNNKLSEFTSKISDEEQWRLSVNINAAVELTDKEATNRHENLKMVEEYGSKAIKSIEAQYKKVDFDSQFISGTKKLNAVIHQKTAFIAFVCSKISQCIKTIVKMITKHTFLSITGLIIILIAL